jgi:UDP-N-acetylmuramyl-tripeptide synthetase
MLLADLLQHLDEVDVQGPVDRHIHAVTHDSRLAGADHLFVAVQGTRVDGRRFVPGLQVAAVLADGPVTASPGVTVLQVPDARKAMGIAAAAVAGFPSRQHPVVGITGTNGKTTTSWMLEAIAAAAGQPCGVIGTTGHRVADAQIPTTLTTPEAPELQSLLARARDAGCPFTVVEVSSIGLTQSRVDGTTFQVGIFTNLSRDHLDHHGTMEAYLAAKRRLFTELLSSEGTAISWAGDPALALFPTRAARHWTYGTLADVESGGQPGSRPDILATEIEPTLAGSHAQVHTPMGTAQIHVPLPGGHNLCNGLAALGAALALGMSLEEATAGLASCPAVPGRLERVSHQNGPDVMVDYAHTPDALGQVLTALRPLVSGALVTVFGCGGDRDAGKRPQMAAAALAHSDRVLVTSDNPRSEDPAAIVAAIIAGREEALEVELDRALAIRKAIADAGPRDCVLIAGKGHEAVQIIGTQHIPFSDVDVAAQILQQVWP